MQLFRGNLFFVCFHLTIHFLKYRQKRGDPLLEHVNNFPFRKQENLRTSEAISPLRHYSSLRMFQSKQNHSSPGDNAPFGGVASGGQDQGYFTASRVQGS